MPSTNNAAAQSSATPMPIWMARFGRRATTPDPDHAPSTAAPIIATSVRGSTLTAAMNMSACAMVGSA